MIQDKLDHQIDDVMIERAREPMIIVMHPQTWVNLVEEVISENSTAINKLSPGMLYRGIKVFRSLDLLEGEFEM